jgi:hypothetical protein
VVPDSLPQEATLGMNRVGTKAREKEGEDGGEPPLSRGLPHATMSGMRWATRS